jgi:hypothetical protein
MAARVYGDYLEGERVDELATLLRCALDHGYEAMTLSSFAAMASTPGATEGRRILLVRHDIDSDVDRARRMAGIERRLGIVGSWFFRRSTWDDRLVRKLAGVGFEVGYHYEELSTLMRERGVGRAAEALALVPLARARLEASLAELRATTGLALDVLAAHGDFANRAVGVSNVELLRDPTFRAKIGVRLEAYDIEEQVDARFSDSVEGATWRPPNPLPAVLGGAPVVEVLIHPRAWGAAPVTNLRVDVLRLRDGCRYRLRRARRRAAPGAAGGIAPTST